MKNHALKPKELKELKDRIIKENCPYLKPVSAIGYNYILEYQDKKYRVQVKIRQSTTKYDIAPSQEDGCDIFAWIDLDNNEISFLSNKVYMENCELHSFWKNKNKRYKGKKYQLSMKKFKVLATKNIFNVADNYTLNYGVLPI